MGYECQDGNKFAFLPKLHGLAAERVIALVHSRYKLMRGIKPPGTLMKRRIGAIASPGQKIFSNGPQITRRTRGTAGRLPAVL
jgi:hypothetical protein